MGVRVTGQMSTWHVTVWPSSLPGLGRDTVMRQVGTSEGPSCKTFYEHNLAIKNAWQNGIGQAQVVNLQWGGNVKRSETSGRIKKQKVLICVLRACGGTNRRFSCLGNDLTHSLLHACNILCFYTLRIGPKKKFEITDKVTLCHQWGTRNVILVYEKKRRHRCTNG